MILPARTTTAPIGTSPAVYAFCACRKASRMKYSSFGGLIIIYVVATPGGPSNPNSSSSLLTGHRPVATGILSINAALARKNFFGLSATASRSLPIRECPQAKQDQKGRSGHHLSPEYSRSRDCNAGLRANRRGAFGGFRWI